MRRILYIAVAFLAMSFMGCSTNDIDSWSVKGFAWFTDTIVNFTNMSQPDVAEGGTLRVAIPLTVASDVSDHDRTINVEVYRQPSDSRTRFEVETPVTFHAGKTTDSMYVDVINSSHLDAVYDTIGFRVIASDDFEPGLKSNTSVRLCLHNGYAQPDWWDSDCVRIWGYFTQLKMQVYVAVTGGTDDIRSEKNHWSSSDIAVQYWTYLLTDYIEQNDIRYPDDDPNAPGRQPSFSRRSY